MTEVAAANAATVPTKARKAAGSMLGLPERGDVIAKRWANRGLIVYVSLAGTFVWTSLAAESRRDRSIVDGALQLLGIGHTINWTTLLLVVGGVLLTLASMRTVRADFRRLAMEESDVAWVLKYERNGLLYVFLDPAQREQRFRADEEKRRHGVAVDWPGPSSEGARVESIVDDRVRRVQRSAQVRDTLSLSPEEFRIIAEKRTATLGGLARYFAALLLLLAVVGTFAGVKTALPDLIRVFEGAASATSGDAGAVAGPLQLVADAFGGNALALIGAIALGIMAQGLAFGRQAFLERLELVSVEYIYRVHDTTSGSPLETAMRNLEKAADGLRGSNAALADISLGLTALGVEFRTQIGSLDRRLAEVATRHESNLYNENAKTLNLVNVRLAELADAVSANAGVYAGLVNRIDLGTQHAQKSVEALLATNAGMVNAVTAATRLNDEGRVALRDIAVQSSRLEEGAAGIEAQIADLGTAVTTQLSEVRSGSEIHLAKLVAAIADSQPTLRQLDASIEGLSAELSSAYQESMQHWTDTTGRTIATLEQSVVSLRKAIADASSAAAPSRMMPVAVTGPSGDPALAANLSRLVDRTAARDRLAVFIIAAMALGIWLDVAIRLW